MTALFTPEQEARIGEIVAEEAEKARPSLSISSLKRQAKIARKVILERGR